MSLTYIYIGSFGVRQASGVISKDIKNKNHVSSLGKNYLAKRH